MSECTTLDLSKLSAMDVTLNVCILQVNVNALPLLPISSRPPSIIVVRLLHPSQYESRAHAVLSLPLISESRWPISCLLNFPS